MPKGFIDINDAGITLAIDGIHKTTSPGYAVLDEDKLLLGKQAATNARLLPSWTNNRFWHQLNSDPIANSTSNIRHHADLAFGHLEMLWQQISSHADEVVISVPSWYNRTQLGLLLGMTKEAAIPVSALVDSALIAVAEQNHLVDSLYLDISLHQISLTQLSLDGAQQNSTLRQTQCHKVVDFGLFTLWDRWANIVAQQFIQSSRYDPMHQATSEQQLYNQVPNWVENLNREGSKDFNLNIDNVSHNATISATQLLPPCESIYPAIIQSIRRLMTGNTTLFISHRFQGFPGLADSLALIPGLNIQYLDYNSAIQAATTHWDNLSNAAGNVSLINALPISRPVAKSTSEPTLQPRHQQTQSSQSAEITASHLLLGHRAYPINKILQIQSIANGTLEQGNENPQFTLYRRGENLLLETHIKDIRLNSNLYEGESTLQPGDEISIAGHSAVLIAVS
ncbi:MAG: hypothetical protein KUG79_10690 [Pseudomonadales bacterium]|nr:hypothetical protein [Pseudomonadales bacterium]